MLVHIIADYGFGDLAFAEVVQRIKFICRMLSQCSRACCHTCGWILYRAVSKRFPAGTIIYHNVAPREDDEQARPANAGERLAFHGYQLCALSASTLAMPSPSYAMRLHYAGLLLLQKARSFGLVTCFRKRQLLLLGQPDAVAEKIPFRYTRRTPIASPTLTAGNLKTTIKHDVNNVRDGSSVRLRIGDREQKRSPAMVALQSNLDS